MRIAFLCKRRYMSKDVILDRYARLYEIPHQLAQLGHEVHGWCMDYHQDSTGAWQHDAGPGALYWTSASLGRLKLPGMLAYPFQLEKELRAFAPDILIGASDIPHVFLAARIADKLGVPYMVDLYDNFEGFAQARIPGFVSALRWAARNAALVTTTSTPLQQLLLDEYGAKGQVIAMPSSVDLSVFEPGNQALARKALGLPDNALLIGTAGGLYRDKGIQPLYEAWHQLRHARPDVHLVLAGPTEKELPPPDDDRVHLLGNLSHAQVATLFRALDVGVISILDTPFGRYCFPQKAYEMIACQLPIVTADVGEMSDLFVSMPRALFSANDSGSLVKAVIWQLENLEQTDVSILDWAGSVKRIEHLLQKIVE
ncbi:glycosyltransferase family 4 protein [Halopseudomonas sp.]|uniref:glycosyltransferase family 4 protein n=1 Tax=Halopseudomonas sp. TaxID=2901191 RepID=UPI0030024FD2